MNCARTHHTRTTNYADLKGDGAAALRRAILGFVAGIRGERKNAVTKDQIVAWFRSTPADFVKAAIWKAIAEDELDVCRTSLGRRVNSRSVYELTTAGRTTLTARNPPRVLPPVEGFIETDETVHISCFARGELVMYMFDTGALGLRPLYGIVEQSGPKMATVRWQSGIKNRVKQDRTDIRRIDDEEMREEARAYLNNTSRAKGAK